MNDPARGATRPMASSRRASWSGPRGPADPGADPNLQRVQPRIPWSRRVGIVVVLVVLGGTVVLAGSFLDGSKPGPRASPSGSPGASATSRSSAVAVGPTPRSAPVLEAATASVIAVHSWTAHVTLTATGIPRKQLRLRFYRNNTAVLDVAARSGSTQTIRNIPLKSGSNAIAVTFVAPAGEGPRSNVVTVTVDDVAPHINLTQPQDHAIVNAETVTLSGQTEAQATVAVSNLTAPQDASTSADANGHFSVDIPLVLGGNDLKLTATDAVGNTGQFQLTVTRGSGTSDATLTLSRLIFHLRQLPATFDATFTLTASAGATADGASVVFSLSPPGSPTSTYQATMHGTTATWTGVTLPAGTQAGNGFVTARVTLQNGSTFQGFKSFSVK